MDFYNRVLAPAVGVGAQQKGSDCSICSQHFGQLLFHNRHGPLDSVKLPFYCC